MRDGERCRRAVCGRTSPTVRGGGGRRLGAAGRQAQWPANLPPTRPASPSTSIQATATRRASTRSKQSRRSALRAGARTTGRPARSFVSPRLRTGRRFSTGDSFLWEQRDEVAHTCQNLRRCHGAIPPRVGRSHAIDIGIVLKWITRHHMTHHNWIAIANSAMSGRSSIRHIGDS